MQFDTFDISVKKLVEGLKPIEQAYPGEWFDLRSAETVSLKAGEYHRLRLGIAVKLPPHCEVMIAPRSSTFEKWGVIAANSPGVVDNKYCGENDEWHFPIIAFRDTKIHKNDRICQFRVYFTQYDWKLSMVDSLNNDENRGGFGSTGVN